MLRCLVSTLFCPALTGGIGNLTHLLAAQASPEVALLLSGNGSVSCFLLLLQSLPAEKENGPVLHLYHKDICLWTLDNLRLLALLSALSDDDPISWGKVCHNHLLGAGSSLLIGQFGPSQDGPLMKATTPFPAQGWAGCLSFQDGLVALPPPRPPLLWLVY
jgi:hypothetical protein